jgi:alpha-beta hydrolase superfamily lysophospholipase
MGRTPGLSLRPARDATRLVVLVLPGGRAQSSSPVRPWNLSYLRMVPFCRTARHGPAGRSVATALLRYRVRGWNGAQTDPVRDAGWALDELRRQFPGVPVVLLGHSMGGRAALALLAEPDVVATIVLAPWLPPGEPRVPLGTGRLLVMHGTADRWTDPAASREYVERVDAAGGDATWVPVPGVGHFMLRRRRSWRRAVTGFLAQVLAADGQAAGAVAPNLAGDDADLG